MNYRTIRLSATATKSKKHVCYGRPAAVYFSNEKVLMRWMAIVLFLSSLALSVEVEGAVRSALCARPSYVEDQRTERLLEEYELKSPQPGVDPVFGPPGLTNLVTEQAEQDTEAVAQDIEPQLWPDYGPYNYCYYHGESYYDYNSFSTFVGDDIISNFFANVGQLVKQWFFEHCSGIRLLFGFAALFAVSNGLRSNVRLPARQRRLRIQPAKSRAKLMLSFRRRPWHSWNIRSWWA